ncbi:MULTISPECIES: hypothetical protein [Pseudomonas syringae group]|uniref:Uncharacterized protein n=2 Tax=Pseudomonas syringae group TaxID=136849 RepID=A0ABX6H7W4_9PSED|nr:hypothetical protein [Pseudomonas asturiensis]QHF01590.1 hypothetical protein N015_03820 [Pseudomonas asturiensis]
MSPGNESCLYGTNLVSFGEGVEAGLRQDVLDCLLYAQLKADDETSRQHNWRGWLHAFQHFMQKAGARQSAVVGDNMMIVRGLGDLSNPRFLGASSSAELRGLFNRSIDTLMTSEQAKNYFRSWFSSGRSESVQVVPCVMERDEEVTIMLCGIQLTTLALRPGFFFWDVLRGEMRVHYAGASYRFSRTLFEPSRSQVQETLDSHATRQIIQL